MAVNQESIINNKKEEEKISEWKELEKSELNNNNNNITPAFPNQIKEFIEKIQTHNIIAQEIMNDTEFEIKNAIPYNISREIKVNEHNIMNNKVYTIKDRIVLEALPINLIFGFLTTFLIIICIFKFIIIIMDKYNQKYKKVFISILTFGTPLILAIIFKIWTIFLFYILLTLSLFSLLFMKRNRILIRNCFYIISSIFTSLNIILIFSSILFLRMLFLAKINIEIIGFFFTSIFTTVFLKEFLFLFSNFFQIHVTFIEKGCLLCKKNLINSITLKCGHIYHYMCIKGFILLQNNNCPCCSSIINKDIFKGAFELFDDIMNNIIDIFGNLIGIFISIILSLIWIFMGKVKVTIN